ncbi:helix-turn-helix domain-containing protein [Streptomyces pactum]|uniref:Helix-turn-helix domain-containing protein n=1 Tax=Streptomyces pactum TaxID=68249 RepID=A0ABS0NK57_9ACTN|nr:helix-turn-helix transcriptional regulator [Streptomyces pactum]MBH5335579.1 helix-turn-helix domain-containing protein [Streptomyces pactum]
MGHTPPDISPFLKARRAALDPAAVGLPQGLVRRRVRGLRREEVAQLAGISVDYYTRIEQGRAHGISDSVLDAVARALRLSPAEHTYLRNIAGPSRHGTRPPAREHRVRPQLRQLLDALDESVPAFVYGPGLDILAWNRVAGRISFDLPSVPGPERNAARLVFLHPDAKALHPDWEQLAAETVATMRAEAGRRPELLCRIVCELLDNSADFRRHWEAQAVTERTHGTKRIRNPLVGEVEVTYQVLLLPSDDGQVLCTYTGARGSRTERALRELAALTRDDDPAAQESVGAPVGASAGASVGASA